MRHTKTFITIMMIAIFVFSIVATSETVELTQANIVEQISDTFGQPVLRERETLANSLGSFMAEDEIIVFDFQSYSALIVNFSDEDSMSYMWVISSSSEETYSKLLETINVYSNCSIISKNSRCMYVYVTESGVDAIFMTTSDGTKYDEDEKYFSSVKEFLLAITKEYYPNLSQQIVDLTD